MKNHTFRLFLAASATALLAGCASVGVPGFGDAGGCRTVYVFTGGGVQPMNNCNLPRETMMAQRSLVAPQSVEAPLDPDAPVDPAAAPEPVVTPVSAAAADTAPVEKPSAYATPNLMIENADMAAFMGLVRSDYARSKNAGAWGYLIVDALAADDAGTAQTVVDGLAGKAPPDWMSANHLRPWVLAANGNAAEAKAEMLKLKRLTPGATVLGHRALLAEGLGDYDGALAVYEEAPKTFQRPDASEAGTATYFPRFRAFQSQRLLAMREAELLRGMNRDADAVALLTRLSAAAPDDGEVQARLDRAKSGQDRHKPRTLKQAMALALGDEADLIAEQEYIMAAMAGRGAKTPFNHLLSSMRQSALLLDPDNGDIRIAESARLYQEGRFEPALRIAQIGNPPAAQASLLQTTAGLAALQLGAPEVLEALVERSLKIDGSPDAKIQAANSLTSANRIPRALHLIDEAVRQTRLSESQMVFALLARAQAHSQAGDAAAAVTAARQARAIRDDQTTQQVLASVLVDTPQREEGLAIMRHMLADQPDDTSMMNNFGYQLVDGHANAEELDEGYRLLKQAIRLTPDEPNLLDSIGWAYYQYGDFREARRFIEMALDAYEPFANWELLEHMGDVEWRLGEQDEARKHWQRSLDAYPPLPIARKIEGKLNSGLTDPPPVTRDTPEVPLARPNDQSSDI